MLLGKRKGPRIEETQVFPCILQFWGTEKAKLWLKVTMSFCKTLAWEVVSFRRGARSQEMAGGSSKARRTRRSVLSGVS